MGGPGSGRRPRVVEDLGDLHRLSRAELEPMLRKAVRGGRADEVSAIRAELAARTWQNVNPYADAPTHAPSHRGS